MEFTEIIINQILVEITGYIMMYKLGKIGKCFLYFLMMMLMINDNGDGDDSLYIWST